MRGFLGGALCFEILHFKCVAHEILLLILFTHLLYINICLVRQILTFPVNFPTMHLCTILEIFQLWL